jgi:hypothetical protein
MRSIAALIAFGAATAAGLLPDAALAGPSSGLRSGAVTNSPIQQIDYRRCWTRDGKRHCRWVSSGGSNVGGRDDNAIPAYGAGRPENYRVGTAEWYRAMERDGRLSTEGSSP